MTTLETAEWLVSPAGRAAYEQAASAPLESLAATSYLRRAGYSAERSAALLTLRDLRAQAVTKFGPAAARMFFTRMGLEQATRATVAAHHAYRLRQARSVVDLGCGIGGAPAPLPAAGLDAPGVELAPATAVFAQANAPAANVLTGDAATHQPHAGAVWLDPARRTATGRRIMDPESWFPPLSRALETARRFPAAGIKVAPGIQYEALPADCQAE
ncbi:hypothetical protein [Neoactinobaculum massilliense]|uniref:hypothetical protein n=1 Tax=Neoactinobaculum massilliense TaxID=2364794 RepID=UPI000F543019|nr:hypothetical protein [Neoactinobaculum massilliense]